MSHPPTGRPIGHWGHRTCVEGETADRRALGQLALCMQYQQINPEDQPLPPVALPMAQAGIRAASLLPSNIRVTRASSFGFKLRASLLAQASPLAQAYLLKPPPLYILRVTRASSSGAAPGPSTLTAAAPRTKKKTHLLPLLLLLLPLLPQILMLPLLLPLGMRSFTHCTVRWSMPTAYQT